MPYVVDQENMKDSLADEYISRYANRAAARVEAMENVQRWALPL